jgi:hypothetical protein
MLLGSRERFDFFKKSAEAGCSWGQVEYGEYFQNGRREFVEKDKNSESVSGVAGKSSESEQSKGNALAGILVS